MRPGSQSQSHTDTCPVSCVVCRVSDLGFGFGFYGFTPLRLTQWHTNTLSIRLQGLPPETRNPKTCRPDKSPSTTCASAANCPFVVTASLCSLPLPAPGRSPTIESCKTMTSLSADVMQTMMLVSKIACQRRTPDLSANIYSDC